MKNSKRKWKYCRLEIGSSEQMKGKKLNKLSKDLIKLRCPTSAALVHMQLRTVLLTKIWTRATTARACPAYSYNNVLLPMTKKHGLEQSIHIQSYLHNILLLLSRAVIGGEQCSYQSHHLYKDNGSCSMNRAATAETF